MTNWPRTMAQHSCRHCESHRCRVGPPWPTSATETTECATCGQKWYANGTGWATFPSRPWKPGDIWWGAA